MLQIPSSLTSKSENKLDPCSSERSFDKAMTSALNPEQSLLDLMKANLAKII